VKGWKGVKRRKRGMKKGGGKFKVIVLDIKREWEKIDEESGREGQIEGIKYVNNRVSRMRV
jgi:hypothetical protein